MERYIVRYMTLHNKVGVVVVNANNRYFATKEVEKITSNIGIIEFVRMGLSMKG